MALDNDDVKDSSKKSDKANVRALVFGARPKDLELSEAINKVWEGYGRSTEIEIKKQYVKGNSDEPTATKTPQEDPFATLGAQARLLEPPFDMLTLSMLPEHNTVMQPCLDAMEVNCDGLGHRFIPRVRLDPDDKVLIDKVDKERVFLENFFAYAHADMSFTNLRKRRRRDLETTGNAYWEVIRGPKGLVQGFEHVPAYLWRLGRQEMHPYESKMKIIELQEDGTVKAVDRVVYKRFRTFALMRAAMHTGNAITLTAEVVWFKEFGDDRVYDNRTGDIVDDPKAIEELDPKFRAAEVLHFKLYSPRTPYGIPRYIGNLLNIYGARGAEEVNFVTLKSNNIPSMVFLVSNGQLTSATIGRIKEFAESSIQGSDNYSKILLVEAESAAENDMLSEDAGNVKVDIKPLTNSQHTDAMFVNYRKDSREEIRGVWRISPIFLGNAADHTRSNAEQSRKLTDEQVFAPERDDFDAVMNRLIFPALGIVYHLYRSNTPPTTDNTELIKILADAEKTGGMNPEIARQVLEEILNRDLPEFPANFPKDLPFSLLMAEAVKNMAEPTSPAQQVTAIKDGDSPLPPTSDKVKDPVKFVHGLVAARANIEAGWKKLLGQDEQAEQQAVGDGPVDG